MVFKFVIVSKENITSEMSPYGFGELVDTGELVPRWRNKDGSKNVFYFKGSIPECFEGMDVYTRYEIAVIKTNENWN